MRSRVTSRDWNRSWSFSARSALSHAVELLRVLEMDEGEARVVFEHAHFEDAHHGELLEPRKNARRGDQPLRGDQRHLVFGPRAERARELRPEHDAEFPRHERLELPRGHMQADLGDFLLKLRHDAAHQRPPDGGAEHEHSLRVNEGRRRSYLRMLGRFPRHRLPTRETVVHPGDLHVRDHAENARANFLLEPVHHREHHDQRGDAERDAEHRSERNEGDEVIAALGARVAQPDEEFVLHARSVP